LPILSSSVLTALITAIVSKRIQDKSNKLKYVTGERQKWREELRAAAVALRRIGNNERERDEEKGRDKKKEKEKERDDANEIIFKTVAEAKTFFQVRLNPKDPEDIKLLSLIEKQKGTREEKISAENLDKLSETIACLLKHDWERVKQETSSIRLTSIYKIIVLLEATLLSCKLFNPKLFDYFIKTLNIDNTLIKSISVSYLCALLMIPLLLILLGPLWRKCKKKISTSDHCVVQYIGEVLNIPYRKSIKIQENKNGKNN